MGRLQAEYQKLESRIQAMYIDKLDGKILGDFFESMFSKGRDEQSTLLKDIQKHQNANQHYLLEGIQLIELAWNAYSLFIQQVPTENGRKIYDAYTEATDCSPYDGWWDKNKLTNARKNSRNIK